MNTNQWTPVLVASILVISSVQAFADSGWYYDEDSDTVIHNYSGSPISQPASRSESESTKQDGTWYYDEGSDNIVFNNEGSRSHYIRTSPSIDTFEHDAYLAFLDK